MCWGYKVVFPSSLIHGHLGLWVSSFAVPPWHTWHAVVWPGCCLSSKAAVTSAKEKRSSPRQWWWGAPGKAPPSPLWRYRSSPSWESNPDQSAMKGKKRLKWVIYSLTAKICKDFQWVTGRFHGRTTLGQTFWRTLHRKGVSVHKGVRGESSVAYIMSSDAAVMGARPWYCSL